MFNLNAVIASILDIDAAEFVELKANGMRPVKAAIKAGACPRKSQLIAGLQLAVTEEEINTVYSNDNVKSCMTGSPVGEFYSSVGVGVIYSSMFRVLVNLNTGELEQSSYGYHREPVMKALSTKLRVSSALPYNLFRVQTTNMVTNRFSSADYQVVTKTVHYFNEESLNTPYLSLKDTLLLQEYVRENINTIESGYKLIVLKTGTLVALTFTVDVYTYVDYTSDSAPEVGVVDKCDDCRNTFSTIVSYSLVQSDDCEVILTEALQSEIGFDVCGYIENNPHVYIPFLDSESSYHYADI